MDPFQSSTVSHAPSDEPRTSALAIVGMVLACLFFLPLIPLVGLIVGVIARRQIKRSDGRLTGKGLATASILVGIFTGIVLPGALMAIAIPSFINFNVRAKMTEARVNLSSLKVSTESYFVEHGALPVANTDWAPAMECCAGENARCAADDEVWTQEPWSSLAFSPSSSHRYQYRFESDGTSFLGEARGDVDCDGKFSVFRLSGRVENDEFFAEHPEMIEDER